MGNRKGELTMDLFSTEVNGKSHCITTWIFELWRKDCMQFKKGNLCYLYAD